MQADLLNLTGERLALQGLHGESGGLIFLNLRDVAFADLSQDLHLGQVVGDEEELGSREARGHRLPVVDANGLCGLVSRADVVGSCRGAPGECGL